MPKAAKITHMRAQLYMRSFAGATEATAEDSIYCVLPLYHATGGLCGVGAALLNGGTLVLRRKFSATHFWDDVADTWLHHVRLYRRTLPLSGQPAAAAERARAHICGSPSATACGRKCGTNSKRASACQRILEFYGSTEGNVSMFNFDGQPGAIGRVPPYLQRQFRGAPGEVRRRSRNAGARRGRPVHPVRARRNRRSRRPDQGRRAAQLYGLRRQSRVRAQNPARRVRERRRLVPHRRSDAPGRGRLFLFRRPHRRHLPLEGRKRLDDRSGRSDLALSRRR